jgi:AcrR family transcriptional regulator
MELTRDEIIWSAVDLIEREGVEAVSMRRIADRLECEVMSLYDHVPSMDAVLDGVADQLLSAVVVTTAPSASWDDQLRALARGFRQVARAYPRSTMVVISRPIDSAAALRPMEQALATLHCAGFGNIEAIRVIRTFVAFLAGCLVREVGVAPGLAPQRPLGQDQAVRSADRPTNLNPVEFPQVMSMSAEFLERDFEAEFEFGVDLIVRALRDLRPARKR